MADERRFVRRVGGRDIETVLFLADLGPGRDLEEDASKAPSLMGLVGELLAHTAEQLDIVDAQYRGWRASRVRSVLGREEKIAEWKVHAEVDADAKFLDWKEELASLNGDMEFLRAYMSALGAKAAMVRARIELLRVTAGATGGLDMRDETGTGPRRTSGDKKGRVAAAMGPRA